MGFFKWIFWGALLLTLPAVFSTTIPALFSGVPAATLPTSSSANVRYGWWQYHHWNDKLCDQHPDWPNCTAVRSGALL